MMKSMLTAAACGLFLSAAAPAFGATYTVDPNHSAVVFKIGHLGVSKVVGRFNTFTGSFVVSDAGALESTSVTVQVTSVDTAVARRDNHLRGADFFNVAQFPTMTFASTGVQALDDDSFEVVGNLTLHGVTRQVTVPMQKLGTMRDRQGVSHIGAEGHFTLKRTDFGMTNMVGDIGDDVEVSLFFEALQQ